MDTVRMPASKRSGLEGVWLVFYAVCILAYLLIAFVYQCVTIPQTVLYGAAFLPVLLCVCGLRRFYPDAFRHAEMRALLLLVCWAVVSLVWNEQYDVLVIQNLGYLCSMVIAIVFFYGYGYASIRRGTLRGVRVAAGVSVAVGAPAALVALIAAFREKNILSPFDSLRRIGIFTDKRLCIFCNPNDTGLILAVCFLFALWLCLIQRKKAIQILLICSMAVLFAAVSLTVSRTAIIALAVGTGMLCFRWLFYRLAKRSMAVRLFSACAAFAALSVGLFFLTVGIGNGYNRYIDFRHPVQDSGPISDVSAAGTPALAAESVQESPVITPVPKKVDIKRAMKPSNTSGTLTGRMDIWVLALKALRAYPERILFGITPSRVVDELTPAYFARSAKYVPIWNVHNAYLEFLVDFGLPALLCFGLFLIYLAIGCVRVFFRPCGEDAEGVGYLPAILAAMLLVATMESVLGAVVNQQFTNIWFFLLAGMLAGNRNMRKRAAA